MARVFKNSNPVLTKRKHHVQQHLQHNILHVYSNEGKEEKKKMFARSSTFTDLYYTRTHHYTHISYIILNTSHGVCGRSTFFGRRLIL